jgi:hypothetical protein
VLTVLVLAAALLLPGLVFVHPASAGSQSHSLSNKEQREVVKLQHLEHIDKSAIRFWRHKGKWARRVQHEKCWDKAPSPAWVRVCIKARRAYKAHAARLAHVERRLLWLVPHDTGYLPPAQAMWLGKRMAYLYYGWSGGQWFCLRDLWGRLESSWWVHSDNPGSPAYGIPQANPGSKMASAGRNWVNSAFVQIKWGLKYVHDKYTTPCGARAVRLSQGGY